MADVNTAEAKADAAFNAAFNGSEVTPPAPAAKVVEEVPAAPAQEPAKPAAAPPAPVAPEKPQYVRILKQDWDNTKAATGKVASLESQLAKLTGSMPRAEQITQQVIESVRSQTPTGTEIDPQVLIDAFADQEKDFPELAGQNRKAIEHVLKHLRGTGPATPPAKPVDINAAVEAVLTQREEATLKKAYPDWSEIVGQTADTPDANNPFRAWLAKQPAEYQKEVNETNSPADVRDAIARFKASQTTSASPSSRPDRAAARRAVIQDAVTPRADGNPPPLNPIQTAEEAFGNAFKAVKSRY